MKTFSRDTDTYMCHKILRYLHRVMNANGELYLDSFLQKIDELYGVKHDLKTSGLSTRRWSELYVPEDLLAIILLSEQ